MKTHFSEQPVAVHPRENIAQNSSNSFRSRRRFISSAACAAGAIGLSPLLGASQERADEAVENYWMALLRDVPFTDYPTDPMVSHACSELSNLSAFTGPRINGQVTPQTLFRGFTAGDVIGPYISQFLLQQVSFGALPLRQQYATYQPSMDYMTDFPSWLVVQNGDGPFGSNAIDRQQLRYLR